MDPDHAHFGGVLLCVRWDLPRSISTPNLKFLTVASCTHSRFTEMVLKFKKIEL